MQKRLLSLLLVACMLLSVIPMMALTVLAEEGEVNPAVSTTFDFDANNPNFPTLDLPEATEGDFIAMGKYDYSGVNIGNSGASGLITYNGGWTLGSLELNWDTATDEITIGTAFNAFNVLQRPNEADLAITDAAAGTWTSTSGPGGGALFLTAALTSTMVAPVNYNSIKPDNTRDAISYLATTSLRYTAQYTGTISINAALAFAWENGVDLVVLHNGEVIATVENNPEMVIGLNKITEENRTDLGTLVSDIDVVQGDTIDFAVVGDPHYSYKDVGDAFDYNHTKRGIRNFAFTVNYEEGWTYIDYEQMYLMSTWDQGNSDILSVTDRDNLRGIHKFFVWHHADGTVKTTDSENVPLAADDYAEINPKLYEDNIITEDMTWEEKWDAYGAYLKTRGILSYNDNWTAGNYVNGEYMQVGARVFTYGYSVYACKLTNAGIPIPTNNWEGQFSAPVSIAHTYIDEYVEKGKAAVQPNEEGKLYFADIEGVYNTDAAKASSYNWATPGCGGFNYKSGVYAIRPADPYATALTYTVPEDIYGTAYIDLNNYLNFCNTTETDGLFCVTLNGHVVFPAGAYVEDQSTWYAIAADSATALTQALADVTFDVKAGDEISLQVARGLVGVKKITLDIKPEIVIEKKHVVEFYDQDGMLLDAKMVLPGAAMPAVPINSVGGYYINDAEEAVATLPEKVTENLAITYAGDLSITDVTVDKVSISIAEDFAINLYLSGDALATKIGFGAYLGNGGVLENWGTEQADGTYKVTIPGIAAKELCTEIDVYLYQGFSGGYEASNSNDYLFKPSEILQSYITDPAYADVKELAQAAYDYAQAADAYFNGGALDADVAGRLAAQDTAIAALSKDVEIEEEYYDYTVCAATVVLKNQVAIKIQVNLTEFDTLTEADLAHTVLVTDEDGNEFECTGLTYLVGSEYMGIPTGMTLTLNGMTPADFDTVYEITMYNADGEQISATVSYSVNAYIARTFENGAGETDDLLRALYALGVAAEAYNA